LIVSTIRDSLMDLSSGESMLKLGE
jgi:hypothetical protein